MMEVYKTKKIITHNLIKGVNPDYQRLSSFSPTYIASNENVDDYLNLIGVKPNQKVLTVLASGDQAFSLISMGIKDIDTFDINGLAEYMALGLKRAMILKYNYEEFKNALEIFNDYYTKEAQVNELISDLLPFMDLKYRVFWQKILNYNHRLQKLLFQNQNLISLLVVENIKDLNTYFKNISYLKNANVYDTLRHQLNDANISFKACNVTKLTEKFAGNYDLLILSNIMDYLFLNYGLDWTYPKLLQLEQDLEKIMSPEGLILLHYIFSYDFVDQKLFGFSHVYAKDLIDEEIKSIANSPKENPSIILKRCKKG